MRIKSFETALSTMIMLTVPEWDRYANHNCADYVAQGKTFTYDEMDRLKDVKDCILGKISKNNKRVYTFIRNRRVGNV